MAVGRYLCRGPHRLDTPWRATYSDVMFRKFIAALFVALWFILLGIEFSEDMGLIEYDEPEIDHSVEATLASLGEAIKITDDSDLAILPALSVRPVAVYSSPRQPLLLQNLKEEKRHFKEDFKIHKLHRIFLI